ncbi:hypothetical protein [Pseudonocardia sp. T1-2H]|uniref:hypothetical protein n=1 Tax=Pseudonocardia sp. T1-2H TaxID=3128899 RepID=UPI0031010742
MQTTKRSRTLLLAGAVIVVSVLTGAASCDGTSSGQKAENGQQAGITGQLVTNQPIPNIGYSQVRQNLIEIETAQAKGVLTTTFFFNQGVPDPIRTCSSIGVPIPNTASLSNPEQAISPYGGSSGTVTVGQMDPNGVYAPQSSSGTYVMCVDGSGKPVATYWEGYVETEFEPAVWDTATHSIKATGPATFAFTAAQK